MSALAHIVGQLGELSESELRQLYLMVGVRLGIPDVPSGALPLKGPAVKDRRTVRPSASKSKGKASSSKGNPQRKSQWANHPLYIEYSRLKKVVEAQAKEAKTSFNLVDSPERRAYQQAFIHWMEAKSSFRDHRKGGQEGGDSRHGDAEEQNSAEKGKAPAPESAAKTIASSAGPSGPAAQPSPSAPVNTGSGSKTTADTSTTNGGKGKAPAK